MSSVNLLLKNSGPLEEALAASIWDNKLSKNLIISMDICNIANEIISSKMKFNLKTVSLLINGVVKIYSRKIIYVLQDCQKVWFFITNGKGLNEKNKKVQHKQKREKSSNKSSNRRNSNKISLKIPDVLRTTMGINANPEDITFRSYSPSFVSETDSIGSNHNFNFSNYSNLSPQLSLSRELMRNASLNDDESKFVNNIVSHEIISSPNFAEFREVPREARSPMSLISNKSVSSVNLRYDFQTENLDHHHPSKLSDLTVLERMNSDEVLKNQFALDSYNLDDFVENQESDHLETIPKINKRKQTTSRLRKRKINKDKNTVLAFKKPKSALGLVASNIINSRSGGADEGSLTFFDKLNSNLSVNLSHGSYKNLPRRAAYPFIEGNSCDSVITIGNYLTRSFLTHSDSDNDDSMHQTQLSHEIEDLMDTSFDHLGLQLSAINPPDDCMQINLDNETFQEDNMYSENLGVDVGNYFTEDFPPLINDLQPITQIHPEEFSTLNLTDAIQKYNGQEFGWSNSVTTTARKIYDLILKNPNKALSLNESFSDDARDRKKVLRTFYSLLILKKENFLDLNQDCPYGDISILETMKTSKIVFNSSK